MRDWTEGRQGGYQKLKLFESKLLKMDVYLLRVPPYTYVPPHIDGCPAGYKHMRLNARLQGTGTHGYINKNGSYGDISTNRFVKFCASEMHDFASLYGCLMLSIGWLRKEHT